MKRAETCRCSLRNKLYMEVGNRQMSRRVNLLHKVKNKRPTWCHLLFYFTSYVLNMFWTLIYPSSGACDYSIELSHWSYCSWFDVCWSFGVVGLEWYPCCRLKQNVVIQQTSRKLLMMDILMSETCWAHKKWNKIPSDIKLVFYFSTIAIVFFRSQIFLLK